MPRPSAGPPRTPDAVLVRLRKMGRPKHRASMSRFGIETGTALGIAVPDLRRLARAIGTDHRLAQAVWMTGVHEARILACMIADPLHMTNKDANSWVRDIDSWDVCDAFAYDLMSRTRVAWQRIPVWAKSDREFTRRAAFSLIAGLAAHDKTAGDAAFIALLPLIHAAAGDDRNFVKKAVNWALRGIGKRNLALNAAAIACAEELSRREARSARWIASNALRELRGEAVQRRLRAR